MISVSLKNMLSCLSFMAQSRSLSACDEQISGPNGIQTWQLCYARVALGEAEGEEGVRGPLREVLVPLRPWTEWHCLCFLGIVFKEGPREGLSPQ